MLYFPINITWYGIIKETLRSSFLLCDDRNSQKTLPARRSGPEPKPRPNSGGQHGQSLNLDDLLFFKKALLLFFAIHTIKTEKKGIGGREGRK